jgi:hypothetical protein
VPNHPDSYRIVIFRPNIVSAERLTLGRYSAIGPAKLLVLKY